ncbi:MAG: hypothetical protein JNM21_00545 [Taibaiella sp.]|nr:hypothetical protein [Taibaiella sp.]
MDKHPDYPEASAFYIHKTLEEELNNFDAIMIFDIAIKIFEVKDAEDYFQLLLPQFSSGINLKVLRITTYNLENDKVTTTHVDRSFLNRKKLEHYPPVQFISDSKIKKGSIVRCQIQFQGSSIFNKFNFQEILPVEYAAFRLKIPKDRTIKVTEHVGTPFQKFVNKAYFETAINFSSSAVYFENRSAVHSWVRRKVPPIKRELFNDDQVVENVLFEFTHKDIEQKRKDWESELNNMTWQDYNSNLYNGRYQIAFEKNEYLYDLIPSIVHKEKDSFIIARLLFKYIQGNFTPIDQDRVFHFETIDEDKEATPLTLNLFLCALYRHAGFQSDLVYISTDRKNPLTPDKVSDKNIAIAVRVIMNGTSYFCNPALKKLPFGYLPYSYYNGYTRLINKTGGFIVLNPELAKNQYNIETALSHIDAEPNKFKLSMKESFGIYGSIREREEYTKDSIAYKNDYKKHLQKLNSDLDINHYTLKVENLHDIESPFMLTAEAEIESGNNWDQLLIDPFLQKVYNGENPFQKMKDRKTDIKMDFCNNFNYTFRFNLGNGITVEALPSKTALQYANPAAIKYTQDASYNAGTQTVEAKYNYDIIPAFYAPEEVEDLNAFYAAIIKASNQKLLLRKR